MGRTRLWLMDEIGWQLRERADDRPVHRVTLPAFAIGAYEVTNAEYAAFAARPGSGVTPPFHWGGAAPPAGKERHPVYNVSWFDAASTARRSAAGCRPKRNGSGPPAAASPTSTTRGATSSPSAGGGAAARREAGAGPPRAQRLQHRPGGGRLVRAQRLRPLRRVGQPVGVDRGLVRPPLLQPEPGARARPARPAGLYRVIRGGSWADTESRLLTVYFRNFTAPDTAQPTIGFRCVRPAPSRSGRRRP